METGKIKFSYDKGALLFSSSKDNLRFLYLNAKGANEGLDISEIEELKSLYEKEKYNEKNGIVDDDRKERFDRCENENN